MRIKFEPMTLEQLLPLVLGPYEKQQRRVTEEFGVDEGEIRKRVQEMREWAEFCSGEHRTVIRNAQFSELFGRPDKPHMDKLPGHCCDVCQGAGIYWSDGCTPRKGNRAQLSVEGFVVCRCEAGKAKNRAIALHGRNAGKSTRRGVQAEEW